MPDETLPPLTRQGAKEKLLEIFADALREAFRGGYSPYYCNEGHVHGKPNTLYTVQIVGRPPHTPETQAPLGLVAFDVLTDAGGCSTPLRVCFGYGLGDMETRIELLEDGIPVWSGRWTTNAAREAMPTRETLTKDDRDD